MPPDSIPRRSEMRQQARRLIQDFRSGVPERSLPAARRFARLASFSARTPEGILAMGSRLQLKHALLVIAIEHGSESWAAFKQWLESEAARPAADAADDAAHPVMHAAGHETLVNRWFTDYGEAKESLLAFGGFLLPFRRQFFITGSEGVRLLGLDPDDGDWERIGWDWIEPHDREAWSRLRDERLRVVGRSLRGRTTEIEAGQDTETR